LRGCKRFIFCRYGRSTLIDCFAGFEIRIAPLRPVQPECDYEIDSQLTHTALFESRLIAAPHLRYILCGIDEFDLPKEG